MLHLAQFKSHLEVLWAKKDQQYKIKGNYIVRIDRYVPQLQTLVLINLKVFIRESEFQNQN